MVYVSEPPSEGPRSQTASVSSLLLKNEYFVVPSPRRTTFHHFLYLPGHSVDHRIVVNATRSPADGGASRRVVLQHAPNLRLSGFGERLELYRTQWPQ